LLYVDDDFISTCGLSPTDIYKISLPAVKFPEMVAEMLPHIDGIETPVFGKDNLWFL